MGDKSRTVSLLQKSSEPKRKPEGITEGNKWGYTGD